MMEVVYLFFSRTTYPLTSWSSSELFNLSEPQCFSINLRVMVLSLSVSVRIKSYALCECPAQSLRREGFQWVFLFRTFIRKAPEQRTSPWGVPTQSTPTAQSLNHSLRNGGCWGSAFWNWHKQTLQREWLCTCWFGLTTLGDFSSSKNKKYHIAAQGINFCQEISEEKLFGHNPDSDVYFLGAISLWEVDW